MEDFNFKHLFYRKYFVHTRIWIIYRVIDGMPLMPWHWYFVLSVLLNGQVRRAEEAGFVAIIVFSNSSDELVIMDTVSQDNTSIPAVFVGENDGILLWDKYVWTSGYYVVITEEHTKMTMTWELILILIPVSIVVIPLAAIVIVTLVSPKLAVLPAVKLSANWHAMLMDREHVIHRIQWRKMGPV